MPFCSSPGTSLAKQAPMDSGHQDRVVRSALTQLQRSQHLPQASGKPLHLLGIVGQLRHGIPPDAGAACGCH